MTRKFSYEEVKEYIENKGGELISTEYHGNTEKIKILCSLCKEEIFEVSFSDYKYRNRIKCPKCVKKEYKPIRWNYDLVKEYVESHGNELISTEYINVDEPMKFKCKVCGSEYTTSFYNYRKLEIHTCKVCSFEKMGQKQAFTHDYVKKYIEDMGSEIINGKYKNNTSKLKIKCVSCGKSFDTSFAVIRIREKLTCKHCSCVEANDDRRFTYDYIKNYIETNSECKLLSDTYTSNRDKLKIQCPCEKHNVFETTFYKFKYANKRQCNECSKRTRWTIDMIRDFVNKHSTCELLSTKFVNVDEKLKFRCECGVEFDVSWDKFRGKRKQRQCPDCSSRSNLERKCKEFFDSNNIKYKREKSFKDLINPKTNGYPRYDFYLKQYNLIIECQGKQHEEETNFYGVQTDEEVKKQFEELIYRDELKRKYAEDNGIDLLYIWYYELDNIPEILTTKLKLN